MLKCVCSKGGVEIIEFFKKLIIQITRLTQMAVCVTVYLLSISRP